MAGFRTLWAALVGMYDETLVLVGGNLLAIALNVPLFLLVIFAASILNGEPPAALASAALATLMTFMPTPGNLALGGVTQVAASPEIPRLRLFTTTLRTRWGIAWRCALVSMAVLVALLWNIAFYVNLGPGWPLLVTILWLYATVFWVGMHIYLVPLAVHVSEPRVLDLYRRAAFVCIGHPGYTFVLLVLLLIVTAASVVFLPVYVLLAQSFVSLAQAQALREIRRRHGDLAVETEEEASRL
ncbi:MAG TPA: hypothetical protein VGJ60_05525 [Chloroflexota bacterium]|jgi:uncharacterized membrane protein YesL